MKNLSFDIVARNLTQGAFTAVGSSVGRLENRFGMMAAVIGRAFTITGVAVTAAGAAAGYAVRNAATEMDKMTKMAQSIGVPVEELSRLEHAADLSGVGIEGLSKSLGRLSRGMTDIATGAGLETKKAFDALGVSVTDSQGQLKSSTQVMTEIAGRFERMEDGATKTGLAMTIFGRSGAQLIPLLNQGAAGLAKMTAEADRLGLTIDLNAGRAAEAFNDNLTRLGKVKDGIILKITAGLLPTLERLSDVFVTTANDAGTMNDAVGVVSGSLKTLVTVSAATIANLRGIGAAWAGISKAIGFFSQGEFRKAGSALSAMGAEIAGIVKGAKDQITTIWTDAPSETQINRRVANAFGEAGGVAGREFKASFDASSKISERLKQLASAAMKGLTGLADETNQQVEDIRNVMSNTADYVSDRFLSLSDAIRSGQSPLEALRDTALSVLDDIYRATVRSGFMQIIGNLFGGQAMAPLQQGIPLFGAGDFNSAGQLSFAGSFGDGGRIPPGSFGIAGERGEPELVTGPADIMPMSKLGGGGTVTYAPVYNIDARGADAGVEQRLAAMLAAYDRKRSPELIREATRATGKTYAIPVPTAAT